ncbi:hypothetical protein NFI96_032916, partial [Prochilodus magdalenae]
WLVRVYLNPFVCCFWVQGSGVLTVQLSDEELCQGEGVREDAELFLVFTGSTQRHISSTLRVSRDTLQAVCPAHKCCESVVVTACSADPDGLVRELASERLCFVQDLAFDMAQFLVGAVGRADMLESAMLLDEHQIPLQECERMDQNLSLALSHLTLPTGWSLLGNCSAPEPQETLLHFAARRGLWRVARFLLQQPGAPEALALPNKQGVTPASLAQSRGHSVLLELLTQEEPSTRDSSETRRRIPCGAGVAQHHPCLNTYTLSADTQPGTTPRSLQADLQDLRCLIRHDAHGEVSHASQLFQGEAGPQPPSESPHSAGECADSPETTQPCFEQPQHDSLDTGAQESTSVFVKGNTTEHNGCCPGPLRPGHPAPPSDNGNSDEKRVCACENTEGDYGVQAESAAACVEGWRKEGDSGDCLQSTFRGESAAHQTSSCGKEGEETDRAQDSICEAQATAEGPKREVQAENCNSVRPDQDQILEDKLSEQKAAAAAGDMGITQSLDTPESSDVESQGTESDDEKEVESADISSLEVEEKSKGAEEMDPGVDQPSSTLCEKDGEDSNGTDLYSTPPSSEDGQEWNASQDSDEQQNPGKDDMEGQEEGSDTLCPDSETGSSQQQSDPICHQGGTTEGTPGGRHLENDTPEKIQAPLEAETRADERVFNSVTPDAGAVSMDSHSPEQEPETTEEPLATWEPDPTELSGAATESESGRQCWRSSGDASQPEIDSEPESPTPSSEDTLEPEDGCAAEGVSWGDPHELATPTDTIESQVTSEDSNKDSSTDICECAEGRTEDITSHSGDVEELCPLETSGRPGGQLSDTRLPENNESVPAQGDETVPPDSVADQSEEPLETRTSETSETPGNDERASQQEDGTVPQHPAVDQSEEDHLSNTRSPENGPAPENNEQECAGVSQNPVVDQSEEPADTRSSETVPQSSDQSEEPVDACEKSETPGNDESIPAHEDGTVSPNPAFDQSEDPVDTRSSEHHETPENNLEVEHETVPQNSEPAGASENRGTPENDEGVLDQGGGTVSQSPVPDQSEDPMDTRSSEHHGTPENDEGLESGTVPQSSDQSADPADASENSGTPENNEGVLEQGGGTVSQSPAADQSEEREELGDTTRTETSQAITEEEQSCLDHADSVGGVASTSDTVHGAVSLQGQSRVGGEDSSTPAVVDTGSVDLELTEAQKVQRPEETGALRKGKDVPLEDQVDCPTCPDENTDSDVSMCSSEESSHRDRTERDSCGCPQI